MRRLFLLASIPLALCTLPSSSLAAPPADETDETDNRQDDDRRIRRWPPQRMTWELGVFGGVFVPSRAFELFEPDDTLPQQGYREYGRVAPELGARAAFFPIRHFGIEAEGAWMPTQTRGDARAVNLFAGRGHLVGQIGLWSLVPFITAGVGVLGVASARAAVGSEADLALNFGAGLKAYVAPRILVRLDGRAVLSNSRGVGEGVTASPEVLLGLSWVLGKKGESRGEVCADSDRDGDNIPDTCDQCPDDPGPAPSGCPLEDRDEDTIPDPVDQCPDTPESRNGFEDQDGCPDEVPEEFTELVGVIEGIHFDLDKDTIKKSSSSRLDRVAEVLNRYPDVRVEITGHTDSTGSYSHNMDLSRRRAEAVKVYLVAKGVSTSRIVTRGAGPSEPVASNKSKDGRAKNRRIEFQILSGGKSIEASKSSMEGK